MSPGNFTRARGFSLIVLVVLIAMVSSSGCIKAVQNTIGGEMIAGNTSPPAVSYPGLLQSTSDAHPAAAPTPEQSTVITEVSPVLTPNPYVIQHGVRINATPQYSFLYRQPEFTKTYTLSGNGNAVGLQVNVVKGPLFIKFTVDPQYDCLQDPESCRGTVNVPVNRPWMTITVRDNQTGEIVAEDGYGGQFSSDTGKYQFSNSGNLSTSINGVQTFTSVSIPGPRYIAIYREGQFQITAEGSYLDVTISVITGTAPDALANPENSADTSPTPASVEWG
jgi:hypothetical protein